MMKIFFNNLKKKNQNFFIELSTLTQQKIFKNSNSEKIKKQFLVLKDEFEKERFSTPQRLQEVWHCLSWRNNPFIIRNSTKDFKVSLKISIKSQDRGNITTTITIVWS